MQVLESRAYLDRKERDFQKELDKLNSQHERQLMLHSDLIGKIIKRDKIRLSSIPTLPDGKS